MTRKSILCASVLLLLSLSMLISCAQSAPEDWQFESGVPSEDLIQKIEEDYSAYLKETSSYDPSVDGVYNVENYYGVYGGCVPIMFALPETAAMRDVTVADAVFHYSGGNSIIVWCEGEFFSLSDAYESKKLTSEQISTIADLHNTGSFIALD